VVGSDVSFDASSSTPGSWQDSCASGDDTTSYSWNFGDGANGTGITATHAYSAPGSYTVTLTATSAGGSSQATHGVTVVPCPTSHTAPTAALGLEPSAPTVGQAVGFDASTSVPGTWKDTCGPGTGTDDTTYTWDFGDGTGALGARASPAYAAAGTYHVVLTALSAGGSNTAARDLIVAAAAPGGDTNQTSGTAGPEPNGTLPVATPPPPAACSVPRLVGKTLAQAKRALLKAHCRLGAVTRKKASARGVGRVLVQRPKSGTRRPAGTKVAVVVGR
jgi:PKD repeat protein